MFYTERQMVWLSARQATLSTFMTPRVVSGAQVDPVTTTKSDIVVQV